MHCEFPDTRSKSKPSIRFFSSTIQTVNRSETTAVGVGSSWDQLLVSLSLTPSPTSHPSPHTTQVPVPLAGDRALAEARELLDRGDPAGALAALDRVSPLEPAYPFARQLRTHAAAVLRAEARPR